MNDRAVPAESTSSSARLIHTGAATAVGAAR